VAWSPDGKQIASGSVDTEAERIKKGETTYSPECPVTTRQPSTLRSNHHVRLRPQPSAPIAAEPLGHGHSCSHSLVEDRDSQSQRLRHGHGQLGDYTYATTLWLGVSRLPLFLSLTRAYARTHARTSIRNAHTIIDPIVETP